eukprot:CAMPEP_0116946954 /NCGR_PEP_ID=MMETSP0467-20121206/37344_1 /TAXON_ID=283647 /ORGANISM="Mesodinium pulex, Strain SPMC105" /LENGTH=93 /DNA_ID=CAMNT_0004630933 /DNA_START=553 /DNA_END=834 /DNA_ORIENTATION=+
MDKKKADVVGQLSCTTSMQLIAGPMHLLGYDIYNRSFADLKGASRIPGLLAELPKTLSLRILRVFPGYGLGGLGNTEFRNFYHQFNEGDAWNK